jgi:hypothetical protein
MKLALVRQISIHCASRPMWCASACLPPLARQCDSVSVQIEAQFWQLSMHCRISEEIGW